MIKAKDENGAQRTTHMWSLSTEILNLGSLSRECTCCFFLCICGLTSSDSVCDESGVVRHNVDLSTPAFLLPDEPSELNDFEAELEDRFPSDLSNNDDNENIFRGLSVLATFCAICWGGGGSGGGGGGEDGGTDDLLSIDEAFSIL